MTTPSRPINLPVKALLPSSWQTAAAAIDTNNLLNLFVIGGRQEGEPPQIFFTQLLTPSQVGTAAVWTNWQLVPTPGAGQRPIGIQAVSALGPSVNPAIPYVFVYVVTQDNTPDLKLWYCFLDTSKATPTFVSLPNVGADWARPMAQPHALQLVSLTAQLAPNNMCPYIQLLACTPQGVVYQYNVNVPPCQNPPDGQFTWVQNEQPGVPDLAAEVAPAAFSTCVAANFVSYGSSAQPSFQVFTAIDFLLATELDGHATGKQVYYIGSWNGPATLITNSTFGAPSDARFQQLQACYAANGPLQLIALDTDGRVWRAQALANFSEWGNGGPITIQPNTTYRQVALVTDSNGQYAGLLGLRREGTVNYVDAQGVAGTLPSLGEQRFASLQAVNCPHSDTNFALLLSDGGVPWVIVQTAAGLQNIGTWSSPLGSNPMASANDFAPAHWMKDLSSTLANMPLPQIALPGTHDSATAAFNAQLFPWQRTQGLSISDQLQAGIRYFDLRLNTRNGEVWIVHGDYPAQPAQAVLNAVDTFTQANLLEIVLLDFNSVGGSISAALNQSFTSAMLQQFGARVVPSSPYSFPYSSLLPRTLWNNNQRILIFYNDSATVQNSNGLLWYSQTCALPPGVARPISTYWPNESSFDPAKLVADLNQVPQQYSAGFFVLQGIFTPSGDWIAKDYASTVGVGAVIGGIVGGLIGAVAGAGVGAAPGAAAGAAIGGGIGALLEKNAAKNPASIQAAATIANPSVLNWIQQQPGATGTPGAGQINLNYIVIVDYCEIAGSNARADAFATAVISKNLG